MTELKKVETRAVRAKTETRLNDAKPQATDTKTKYRSSTPQLYNRGKNQNLNLEKATSKLEKQNPKRRTPNQNRQTLLPVIKTTPKKVSAIKTALNQKILKLEHEPMSHKSATFWVYLFPKNFTKHF